MEETDLQRDLHSQQLLDEHGAVHSGDQVLGRGRTLLVFVRNFA